MQTTVASRILVPEWMIVSGVTIQGCKIRQHYLTSRGLRMIWGVLGWRIQDYPLFLLEWIVISGVAIQATRIPEYLIPTPVMSRWWTTIPVVWYPQFQDHPFELPLVGLTDWILISEPMLLVFHHHMDIIKQLNKTCFQFCTCSLCFFSSYNIIVCNINNQLLLMDLDLLTLYVNFL